MTNFSLSVGIKDSSPAINFANNTEEFIEVVFELDGKDINEAKRVDKFVRGFGFPPKFEKMFTKTRERHPLPFKFSGHGTLKAYIYQGIGHLIKEEQDIEIPTFMRTKLSKKIHFERTSDKPIKVMQCSY